MTDRAPSANAAPSTKNGRVPSVAASRRARTRDEQRPDGEDRDERAHDTTDVAGPGGVVMVSERTGEEQRPEHDPDGPERVDKWRRGRGPSGHSRDAPLEHDQNDRRDRHRKQERRAFQERVVRVVEVDFDVARRERPGGERGQERPDPERRRDADSLEDVEDEMHCAVP